MMKHVLIINPNKDTFSNPSLVSILETLMKDKGIKVILLSPKQLIQKPFHFEAIEEIVLADLSVNWGKNIKTWWPKLKFLFKLKNICKKEKISTIIAVDPIGLIIGGRIKLLIKKIKLHYFSFEIFFQDELVGNTYFEKLKRKEIKYTHQIDCLLIQDEERSQLLFQENKITGANIQQFFIPVAPNSVLIPGDNRQKWRTKLGISDDKIVLLHSGSLEKWSGGEMLIDLINLGLGENQLLLIHTKTPLDLSNPIHREIYSLQERDLPILIHETVFSDFEEYLAFLQIADLALTLYEKDLSSPYSGKNIEHIGLASGKFSCYLSQGIPVIVTYSKMYEKLNLEQNFAFIVKNVAEIQKLLLSLKKEDLQHKKLSSKIIYEKYLQVDSTLKQYLIYLNE